MKKKPLKTHRQRDETNQAAILGHVTMGPILRTRNLATVFGVSQTSVATISKKKSFIPIKLNWYIN